MAVLWIVLHIIIVKVYKKKEKEYDKGPGQRDYSRKNYPSFCRWYDKKDSACIATTILSSLFLFIISMFFVCGQYNSAVFVKKYEAATLVYEERRSNFSELERVAAFKTTVYLAEELAEYKYRNEAFYGILDIFVSDEIYKLKPIR